MRFMSANPFEVLRLDPASTEEEIVRQGGLLRQRATEETTLDAIRQAVQALTRSPEERALLGLLTHSRPAHTVPELERFVAAYRRLPQPSAPPAVPPLDLAEVAGLLGVALADGLEQPPLPLEAPANTESASEIRRQTSEALWQSLFTLAPVAGPTTDRNTTPLAPPG
jgi:hypothetical protein